jgi:hypothetical protein
MFDKAGKAHRGKTPLLVRLLCHLRYNKKARVFIPSKFFFRDGLLFKCASYGQFYQPICAICAGASIKLYYTKDAALFYQQFC